MTTVLDAYRRISVVNVGRLGDVSDQLDLVAVPTAIPCGQMFVEATLTSWDATAMLADARAAVTDLVSATVEPTGSTTPYSPWSGPQHLKLIKVHVHGIASSIVIEVWDSDPKTSDAEQRNYSHPDCGGRIARCKIDIPERISVSAQTQEMPLPLPRRTPRPQSGHRRATNEMDLELLQRVAEGLRSLDGR